MQNPNYQPNHDGELEPNWTNMTRTELENEETRLRAKINRTDDRQDACYCPDCMATYRRSHATVLRGLNSGHFDQ